MPYKPTGQPPGRPRATEQPTKQRKVHLTDEQWQWLSSQPGGASAALRAWIDAQAAAS